MSHFSWDVKQTLADLKNIAKNSKEEFGAAQMAETEIEATEAQRQTPVDLGPLRASVHAEGPQWAGNVCETAVVAGGPATDYAIIVHEDLGAQHAVGNAKFIERPLFAATPFLAKRIAKRIQVGRMIK